LVRKIKEGIFIPSFCQSLASVARGFLFITVAGSTRRAALFGAAAAVIGTGTGLLGAVALVAACAALFIIQVIVANRTFATFFFALFILLFFAAFSRVFFIIDHVTLHRSFARIIAYFFSMGALP
jgi:hypothetical protein